jgi:hypothetical protein
MMPIMAKPRRLSTTSKRCGLAGAVVKDIFIHYTNYTKSIDNSNKSIGDFKKKHKKRGISAPLFIVYLKIIDYNLSLTSSRFKTPLISYITAFSLV